MSTTETPSNVRQQVQQIIDRMRPAIQADGGDVELVNVVDDVVQIRFHGACHGCPSSNMTLKYGLERHIKEKLPSVKEVVSVA